MIDAARLSGTWTAVDSRSMGLITTTRNAHIIAIFIKHRAYDPRFTASGKKILVAMLDLR